MRETSRFERQRQGAVPGTWGTALGSTSAYNPACCPPRDAAPRRRSSQPFLHGDRFESAERRPCCGLAQLFRLSDRQAPHPRHSSPSSPLSMPRYTRQSQGADLCDVCVPRTRWQILLPSPLASLPAPCQFIRPSRPPTSRRRSLFESGSAHADRHGQVESIRVGGQRFLRRPILSPLTSGLLSGTPRATEGGQ